MFGSNILDVAIGLALIFLLLSLVASGVREAVEAVIKSRAVELERGIRTLLNDPRGEHVARAFYEHPLIYSLYHDEFEPAERRFRGRNLPSYIPARNFAVAILDMVTRGVNTGVYAAQQTAPVLSIEGLRSSVRRLPSPFVQRAVLSAIDNAHGDVKAVQKNLEAWYDSAMDRVSGSYKRRTQRWLFAIGLCTAAVLNVNTITIADYLSHNEQARAALAQRASTILNDSAYRKLVQDSAQVTQAAARAVYADLQSLSLPIGWDLPQPPVRGILLFETRCWSAAYGLRGHAGSAVLVRLAEQGDGDPFDGETAREESGGRLRRSPGEGKEGHGERRGGRSGIGRGRRCRRRSCRGPANCGCSNCTFRCSSEGA
jgi:hypothetical protein